MALVSALIARAMVVVQDNSQGRYQPSDVLGQVNDAVKMSRRLRPDLWYGQYGTPMVDLALTDPFPLPPEYEPAIVKCIVFWCDAREDEYSNDSRGAQFMAMFEKYLTQ